MANPTDRQRARYRALLDLADRPFDLERPAVFSPAAAQDSANDKGLLFRWTPIHIPYEYTSWVEESLAHVQACYIGDWTPIGKLRVCGSEALTALTHIGMNDLSRFALGHVKHHVQLDEHPAGDPRHRRLPADETGPPPGRRDDDVSDWQAAAYDLTVGSILGARCGGRRRRPDSAQRPHEARERGPRAPVAGPDRGARDRGTVTQVSKWLSSLDDGCPTRVVPGCGLRTLFPPVVPAEQAIQGYGPRAS